MSTISIFRNDNPSNHSRGWQDQLNNQRDLGVQAVVSLVFGFSAFLAFCVLRPKWTELYNARKKQSDAAARLPELPKSMFGWIPVLWSISEEEVLASAGLDAYAFLSFFRYAIKYLSVTLFFSVTVILPVNYKFKGEWAGIPLWPGDNKTRSHHDMVRATTIDDLLKRPKRIEKSDSYLWMYVVFAYFYTAVAFYLLVLETKKIIRIRQAYLGTQATVTDRTIKLSGIPADMRSEEKIKHFIEDLEIGKVDSVMLCRDWTRLDRLMEERMHCLRRLEESWATHLGHRHTLRHDRQGRYRNENGTHENSALLSSSEMEEAHTSSAAKERPTHTIRYGPWKMYSKKVDAIYYYEEKLRKFDERIETIRKEEFKATPLAFVTLESTAACQMAVQAILDPTPGQFIASLAPPPADVVWHNTYLSRNHRMARSWTIMVFIGFLTIFWAVLLVPLAGLLSIEVIDKVLPGLANALEAHPIVRSLVQTGLPTLVFSLLAMAVPYLYDWLSNKQGMISQSDVEMSLISKNFFFTFFNLFVVFTVWSTASTFYDFWKELQDILKDTAGIAYAVAKSLEGLAPFYVNLIILQGLGLFPFRLLEFGAVALYPVWLISAKTPRDHAELSKPPIFSYGFYLPQTMLIFVICIVYSVLPSSWLITVFGLVYFFIGGFIYKYQLLYAMEHRQHSTGRAWPLICNRVVVGLVVFQIAMTGVVALNGALTASGLLLPLIGATLWFAIYFQRTFHPLMKFIALRSIDRTGPPDLPTPTESAWDHATDHGRHVDTDADTGLRYMSPNLVAPLETMWIKKTGVHQSRRGPPPPSDRLLEGLAFVAGQYAQIHTS